MQSFFYRMVLLSIRKNTQLTAKRSPYARKVRIALEEKGIPFTLQTEVPWNSTTKTKDYNPLEKLPVLIPDTGAAVYESHFILEWIEAHYPAPKYTALYPTSKDKELFAKQVEVVADGMCDACVLLFFEKQREKPSEEWMARQRRKIDGGLKALNEWARNKEFIIEDTFGLADVAAGAVLGYLKVRFQELDLGKTWPELKRYSDGLEKRESFRNSVPSPQTIIDRIV
jgi:glutathione S-transferase